MACPNFKRNMVFGPALVTAMIVSLVDIKGILSL